MNATSIFLTSNAILVFLFLHLLPLMFSLQLKEHRMFMMPLTLWVSYLCHHTILCLLVFFVSVLHCKMFYCISPCLSSKIQWLIDDLRVINGWSASGDVRQGWCRGRESLLTCCPCYLCCSPGCVCFSRLQAPIAVSCPHTFASGLILSGWRICTFSGWTS